MEEIVEQRQIQRNTQERVALPGPCGILDQRAYLRAQCEASALPDGFAPGNSFRATVDKIRRQHSNYEQLLGEMTLLCMEKGSAGGQCAFYQDLVMDGGWRLCPLLSLLCCELKRFADQKAEEAFSDWRRRTANQRSERTTHFVQGELGQPFDWIERRCAGEPTMAPSMGGKRNR